METRPEVDPRVDASTRATNEEVDESYLRQLRDDLTLSGHGRSDTEKQGAPSNLVKDGENIYVEFEKDDPRNPFNFTRRRKWIMTISACFFTALSAASSSTYNQGFPTMLPDLHTTPYIAGVGLSMYCLGFGIVPLVTASLSEEFGRMPLYVASAAGFAITHMMVALAPNITTVIVGRFLNGAFGSTGATMVGGSIADIWPANERGFFMAVYSISAIGSVGVGACIATYVETAPGLGWRWIQWIHCIAAGAYALLIPVLMKETRSGVILTRLARKIREQSGDHRIRARIEDERGSLKTLVRISCTRPIYLLCTEPVVASFSIWIGFGWGLMYGIIDSISPILAELHNFGTNAVGLLFLSLSIGALLGFATTLYQERLYRKGVTKRGPEARLYSACAAAIIFPVGMFIYAWCAFASVHWMGLAVGIVVFMWGIFIIYAAVFSYLADVYGPFASSALAGQSLARNISGTIFPLFTTKLYGALGYPWSNTIFAILAVAMAPVPYILFFYGPQLRARSKFASAVKH